MTHDSGLPSYQYVGDYDKWHAAWCGGNWKPHNTPEKWEAYVAASHQLFPPELRRVELGAIKLYQIPPELRWPLLAVRTLIYG